MHDRARQLLTQLVNAPDSLSRNRHFSLFEEPRVKHLRRRAAHLRMIRDALLQDSAVLDRAKIQARRTMLRLRYDTGTIQRIWLNNDEAKILKAALWPEANRALRTELEGWVFREA